MRNLPTHAMYLLTASIVAGGAESENAIWSYETPIVGSAAIKEHLAFYPNRVDAIEIL